MKRALIFLLLAVSLAAFPQAVQVSANPHSVNTIWNGSGTPANSLGNPGDFFINTAAWIIYGPKAGTWPSSGFALGPGGGGGGGGVSVTGAAINGSGHLIITLSNGNTLDAGNAVGPQGPTGAAGSSGTNGTTPTFTIGTVTTLSAGSSATVTATGTPPAYTLNFGIPQGASGSGTGTVSSAGVGQFAYYNSSGNTVIGHNLIAADIPRTGIDSLVTTAAAAGTSGNCVKWLSTGDLGDAGVPCGSGTVGSGTAGQVAWYSGSGTAVAGHTLVAGDIPTLNQSTTGNAATATALATTPTGCTTSGQFANGIAANGNLTCATPAGTGGGISGPGTTTVGNVPQYSNTTGTALSTGLSVVTTVGSPGSNSNVATEAAVRSAITAGGGMPSPATGSAGYLTTNGTAASWGNIATGASGALDCATISGTCDVVTSVVPLKASANDMLGLNRFSAFNLKQLTAGIVPATGYDQLYTDAQDNLHLVNSSGGDTSLGGGRSTVLQASSHLAYGDSITYGYEANGVPGGYSSTLNYAALLSVAENATLTNRAISGSAACDITNTETFLYSADLSSVDSNPIYTLMIGTNDANEKGVGAYETNFQNCHKASLSFLATPNKWAMNSSNCTDTGSWTTVGSSWATAAQGEYSNVSGSTKSCPITTYGGPIYVWYYTNDAYVNGSFTYAVDGGSASANVYTAPTSNPTPLPIIQTVGGLNINNSNTYTSGITATGSTGQTCTLSNFNNGVVGATATVALTGTNTIASGTVLVVTASGTSSLSSTTTAPTSATASNGTATCSGTATVTTTISGLNKTYGWSLLRIPVSAGAHTVLFTVTSSSATNGSALFGGIGTPLAQQTYNMPRIFVGGVPKQNNDANSAATAAYNADVLADVQLLAQDGLGVYFVPVRNYLCKQIQSGNCVSSYGSNPSPNQDMMPDGVHPNQYGHQELKQAFADTMQFTPYPSGGTATLPAGTAGQFPYYASTGTTVVAHTLVAGDIPTLSAYAQTANNLSDLANAATARTNLGLGTAATQASSAFQAPLTFTGTGSKTASATAAGASGNCAKWDASGNVVDAGAPCGSGGSGMTWPALAGVANYAGGSAWGTSYTVGTAASNLVQLNGSAQLPAVSGVNLTGITSSQVSGLATSATTDTTNASNITTGTLGAGRLPNPGSSTLGGVQSAAAVSNQWINSISTSGVPALSQPAFSNLSGTATASQLPADYCQTATYSVNASSLSGTAATPTAVTLVTLASTDVRVCFLEILPSTAFAVTSATAATVRLQSSGSTPVIYSPNQDLTVAVGTNANNFWSDSGSMADRSSGGQGVNALFLFPGATTLTGASGTVRFVIGTRTMASGY